jgi:hypothetical protein
MLTVVQNISGLPETPAEERHQAEPCRRDYSFIVEDGPLAILALIVRVTRSPLREIAQDALETVHLRMARAFRISGDTEPSPRPKRTCVPACKPRQGRRPKNSGLLAHRRPSFSRPSFFRVRGLLRGGADAFV